MKHLALYATTGLGVLAVAGTLALVGERRHEPPDFPARLETSNSSQPAPAADEFREVTIPAGTTLALTLDEGIGSATSHIEDPVRAHITRAVMVNGVTAIPANSAVFGAVTSTARPGRVKGRAHITIRFDKLAGLERYDIHTAPITRTAPGTKKKDALTIGLPAAAGAAVGGAVGGKKGALIGTATGGGAGTAQVLSSRGPDVRWNRGAGLSVTLLDPVTVRVPMRPLAQIGGAAE